MGGGAGEGRQVGIRFHPTRGAMSLGQSAGGLPPDSVCEEEPAILADMSRCILDFHDPSRCPPPPPRPPPSCLHNLSLPPPTFTRVCLRVCLCLCLCVSPPLPSLALPLFSLVQMLRIRKHDPVVAAVEPARQPPAFLTSGLPSLRAPKPPESWPQQNTHWGHALLAAQHVKPHACTHTHTPTTHAHAHTKKGRRRGREGEGAQVLDAEDGAGAVRPFQRDQRSHEGGGAAGTAAYRRAPPHPPGREPGFPSPPPPPLFDLCNNTLQTGRQVLREFSKKKKGEKKGGGRNLGIPEQIQALRSVSSYTSGFEEACLSASR